VRLYYAFMLFKKSAFFFIRFMTIKSVVGVEVTVFITELIKPDFAIHALTYQSVMRFYGL